LLVLDGAGTIAVMPARCLARTECAVNLALGVVAVLLGIAMVWVAMPKGDVSPAFMRNGLVELFYPVSCLIMLTVGVAGILSGLPWSFF
jgi:hypothetical protein